MQSESARKGALDWIGGFQILLLSGCCICVCLLCYYPSCALQRGSLPMNDDAHPPRHHAAASAAGGGVERARCFTHTSAEESK